MSERVVFRCSAEEKAMLEAAAAARGMDLSKYARERLLGSGDAGAMVRSWEEMGVVAGRLTDAETNALATRSLLASVLFLLLKKASASDVNELKGLLSEAMRNHVPLDLLDTILTPEITNLLSRGDD